ncbi:MAG: ABC transporter permease subunit [Actinomycetota bacterium]|nr:ABC transporter permease subunit [Actinomycetota bacterium]
MTATDPTTAAAGAAPLPAVDLPAVAPGGGRWRGLTNRGAGVAGIAALLVVWSVAALTVFDEQTVPTPWAVAEQMWADRDLYRPNVTETLREAGAGYLIGNLAAFAVGLVFVLAPPIERLALRLVIAIYCLPLIAVAPILQIVMSSFAAKATLAAQAVFFTTLIGVTLGLRSADRQLLEVIWCAGGGRWEQFRRARLRSAVPAVFSGLKVAAPAALLGAVIGEFLGGSRGLGVALIASQQGFMVTRTWGIAMVLTLLAVIGYVGTAALGRALAPWSSTSTLAFGAPPRVTTGPLWRRAGGTFVYAAASTAVAVGAWWGLIELFDLDPFFAKTPADVWAYLVTDPEAAANRSQLLGDLSSTLGNAALGYLAGTIGALLLAIAVVSNRTVEQGVMPVAIAVRSVPLVAMTPLIALVFGRGLVCVLIIAGIVTFFPSLVNLVDGLRSAPAPAFDLAHAYGASRLRSLLTIRVPYAVPSLFASARIAAPLAILGAILAEWLATGTGIGNRMILAGAQSRYTTLWASVVVITAAAIAIYGVAAALESLVLRRFAGRTS